MAIPLEQLVNQVSLPTLLDVKDGYAIHMYTFNADMGRSCLANADGDFLIVPQMGELRVKTELGAGAYTRPPFG